MIFLLAVLLSFQDPPPVASISIVCDAEYKPHQKIKLQLSGYKPDMVLAWNIQPTADIEFAPGGLLVWCPPGVYTATVAATINGQTVGTADAKFSVIAPTPPPWKLIHPTQFPLYSKSQVTLAAWDEKTTVRWSTTPVVDALPLGDSLYFWAKPGSYELSATIEKGQHKTTLTSRFTVGSGSDPAPNPTPDPSPVTGQIAWVIVIEETAQASAQRAAYFTDARVLAAMKSKGIKHRIADKDVRDTNGQTPRSLAGYIQRSSGRKLPQLFLVDQLGNILRQLDLPATPAEFAQLIGG